MPEAARGPADLRQNLTPLVEYLYAIAASKFGGNLAKLVRSPFRSVQVREVDRHMLDLCLESVDGEGETPLDLPPEFLRGIDSP
jgi:hypothetical protein